MKRVSDILDVRTWRTCIDRTLGVYICDTYPTKRFVNIGGRYVGKEALRHCQVSETSDIRNILTYNYGKKSRNISVSEQQLL